MRFFSRIDSALEDWTEYIKRLQFYFNTKLHLQHFKATNSTTELLWTFNISITAKSIITDPIDWVVV